MSSVRVVVTSALIACVVGLAVVAWLDARAPVMIAITPLAEGPMRVSVAGAVATPGVVTLPPDARLIDAAEAAGGLSPDADVSGLNLAGQVGDGEHIVIPSRNRAGETPASAAPAVTALDLNVATAAELEALPGIGEVLAGRIVAHREEHGPFASIDELAQVEGVTPRLVEELRPLVTVGGDG